MTEHQLQANIVRFLRLSGFLTMDCDVMAALRYLQNRDNRRLLYINQHKGMGYTNGQPDLLVILPEGEVLFIEVKDGAKGRQSGEQKVFQNSLTKLGHNYVVWRSVDDAIDFVTGYKAMIFGAVLQ